MSVFWGPEYFHDVPGPPAINFAVRNTRNRGLRSSSDQCSSFSDHFRTNRVPKFGTLFEKVNLIIWPLRPKRSLENDPILILSLWGFRKKVSQKSENLWLSLVISTFSKELGSFFEKPVFHFRPSEVSFTGIMCLGSQNSGIPESWDPRIPGSWDPRIPGS